MRATDAALLLQAVHNANYHETPDALLDLPRRRPYSQREDAQTIARLMFPAYTPEKAIIHYELQRKRAVATHTARDLARRETERLRLEQRRPDKQRGPWDPTTDPVSLPSGAPMPVQLGTRADFSDCFAFLKADTDGKVKAVLDMPHPPPPALGVAIGEEPLYKSRLLEFNRGVVYEDGRLDLCKMVVGPDHIDELMDALAPNTHVRHFLLGNNVVTNHGARRIARFMHDHPDRMRTWYLAGNLIKPAGFHALATAL